MLLLQAKNTLVQLQTAFGRVLFLETVQKEMHSMISSHCRLIIISLYTVKSGNANTKTTLVT